MTRNKERNFARIFRLIACFEQWCHVSSLMQEELLNINSFWSISLHVNYYTGLQKNFPRIILQYSLSFSPTEYEYESHFTMYQFTKKNKRYKKACRECLFNTTILLLLLIKNLSSRNCSRLRVVSTGTFNLFLHVPNVSPGKFQLFIKLMIDLCF